MAQLTWKRDRPGRQVSTCGRYAVEVDGLPRVKDVYYEDDNVCGGEWASVDQTRNADGDNIDWHPTMKEAKAECQRHADRQETR